MKKNKTLKVLTTSALLASLAAPFAAPAYADSDNFIDKRPVIADDFDSAKDKDDTPSAASTLFITKDNVDIPAGDEFSLVLPSGVKWDEDVWNRAIVPGLKGVEVVNRTDSTLDLRVTNTINVDTTKIEIPMYIEVDGAEDGPVKVRIDARDSVLTPEEIQIGTIAGGETTTTIDDVKTIDDYGRIGAITIDETTAGAIYTSGRQEIRVKLPSNFSWDADNESKIRLAGGFINKVDIYAAKTGGTALTQTNNAVTISDSMIHDRTLTFYVEFKGQPTTRGKLYVEGLNISADSDANFGDITATVDGDEITTKDLVVAKYADYGADVKADGDVKEIFAGRLVDNDDLKLTKLHIKEAIAGSALEGRKTKITLPSWVKIVDAKVTDSKNGNAAADIEKAIKKDIDGTSNEVEFVLPKANGKFDFKVEFYVSVKADASGDIVAKVDGRSGLSGEATIGKAVTPVAVSVSEKKNVKIGLKGQEIGTITVTENKKEAIQKGELEIVLPDNVNWSVEPTVKVVEGDIDLDLDNVEKSGNVLTIPVDGDSTKPSKIEISGVKLDLDRTVPEGDIDVKVRGNAVVQNYKDQDERKFDDYDNDYNADTVDAGEFDQRDAAKAVVALNATPAPTDTTAKNIVFKLNSKTFTVDGKEQEMDTAPLVGWDRAYLPVRFAANALNVSDSNIVWDDKTNTFTIFKGDRVITGKVGDKFLTVNGVKVPMDVPVWRNKVQTNDRVMVPIRYLANALNANIEWNKETSEITISATK